MPIIVSTDSDYEDRLDGIRSHVNIAYDDANLDESRIINSAFLGRFNIEVSTLVPNWRSLSDNEKSLLKNAVQLKTAAQLLWAEGRIRSEDIEGEKVEYMSFQVKSAIDDYRNQAESIINRLSPTSSASNQVVFRIVNPVKRF